MLCQQKLSVREVLEHPGYCVIRNQYNKCIFKTPTYRDPVAKKAGFKKSVCKQNIAKPHCLPLQNVPLWDVCVRVHERKSLTPWLRRTAFSFSFASLLLPVYCMDVWKNAELLLRNAVSECSVLNHLRLITAEHIRGRVETRVQVWNGGRRVEYRLHCKTKKSRRWPVAVAITRQRSLGITCSCWGSG